MNRTTILNPDYGGVFRTVKANYFKMSSANILFQRNAAGRVNGLTACGILIEHEEETHIPQS